MKKIIWTYWHQGFDEAPYIVQRCLQQLESLHPEYKVHRLDRANVEEWNLNIPVKQEIWGKLSLPHRSDLIRTKLLIDHGGVWIDPTVFCTRSLQDWLPGYMGSGLFLFQRPGIDRIISNWFIASEPDNVILRKLYAELVTYWNTYSPVNLGRAKDRIDILLNRVINRNLHWPLIWFHPVMTRFLKRFPYMIYHYKFYELVRKDSNCSKVWREIPEYSADIPHYLQTAGLLNDLSSEVNDYIDQSMSPLFKLKWDLDPANITEHSNLFYLLNKYA